MKNPMRVACSYQGGKQRVSKQIVDKLVGAANSSSTHYYDLCCGSGAVSIELVNRGISPKQITMLDLSSWGAFWNAIGTGDFNLFKFVSIIRDVPSDKRLIKPHMKALASMPINDREAELYPALQAASFGGKQIWSKDNYWENAFFRDYWEPTETSVRRSPANPMQPSPPELQRRVELLASGMKGVECLRSDIFTILDVSIPHDAVVYIDPPYGGTTGYGFAFEVNKFVELFRKKSAAPLFVSEGKPVSENPIKLTFGGAKGGISGTKVGRHEEWLSQF